MVGSHGCDCLPQMSGNKTPVPRVISQTGHCTYPKIGVFTMSTLWKKAKTAGAFVLAFSMVLPTVGQAGVAQMRPIAVVLSQSANSVALPDLIQAQQRYHQRTLDPIRERRDRARIRDRHDRDRYDRNRSDRDWRKRNDRVERKRPGYRGGYRGYTTPRNGYRRDSSDGLFYPLAAFALGAIIANELNNNQPTRQTNTRNWSHIPDRNIRAHDNWCASKYRSYRSSDKTFQPYNGPRRYCNSPYDAL